MGCINLGNDMQIGPKCPEGAARRRRIRFRSKAEKEVLY